MRKATLETNKGETMKAFEYASPRTEAEVVQFLSADRGETEILAGGTDLIGLMKKMIVTIWASGKLYNVLPTAIVVSGSSAFALSISSSTPS